MKSNELLLILKRLYRYYVKKHLARIIISIGLSLIVAGSTAATAWLLDPAVKKIFIDKDKTLAWVIPLAIVFTFTAKGLSLYFARMNVIIVGARIGAKLQQQIVNTVLRLDIQTLDGRHSGKYMGNLYHDTSHVTTLVSTGVLNLMKDSFTVVALVSLMFYQNWKLAIFAIFMMPLAAIISKTLGKRIGKATGEAGEIAGRMMTFIAELFKASRMIRIYQKENDESENASKVIVEMQNKNIKISSIMIRATPIMEALTGCMIAGFIFYAGILIDTGEIEVNNFFSFLAAMMLAYQPVRSLATINMIAYQGAAAAKRVFVVLDSPIKIKNDRTLPGLLLKKCEIEFKDVSFMYEKTQEKAIKNINLQINGNCMTAFVGHSGAGKSTIINLLPRFYDVQSGTITIDGQNICKVSLESLRKNISLVSQDVILFDDTIKKNILYADTTANEQDIRKACEYAAASEFIEKLPDGYETMIGENGIRLSGGQKQRISIARAILKKAPIILLDEATSSLDADSEEVVQNAITNLTKNKTTLVIAHRLSTIHKAEKIFVLKNGQILQSGNHDFLIKNCEEYKSLYQKQLK
jgi:subfamily B ATP-binding cassette protein MsbA